MVIALGGGAYVEQRNYDLIHENGVSIWLDCPLERIKERIGQAPDRPLARNADVFAELFETRRTAYARSDYRIEIASDDPADAVKQILALPLF